MLLRHAATGARPPASGGESEARAAGASLAKLAQVVLATDTNVRVPASAHDEEDDDNHKATERAEKAR